MGLCSWRLTKTSPRITVSWHLSLCRMPGALRVCCGQRVQTHDPKDAPSPSRGNAYVMERLSARSFDALGAWLICRDYPGGRRNQRYFRNRCKNPPSPRRSRATPPGAGSRTGVWVSIFSGENGGLIGWKRRRPFEHLRKPILRVFLTEIGDKSPQTAEAMDFQGLLVKLIDRISIRSGFGSAIILDGIT